MSSDRAPSATPLTKDDDAWSPGSSLEVDGDREWRGSPNIEGTFRPPQFAVQENGTIGVRPGFISYYVELLTVV
jgi:hypothetical protein